MGVVRPSVPGRCVITEASNERRIRIVVSSSVPGRPPEADNVSGKIIDFTTVKVQVGHTFMRRLQERMQRRRRRGLHVGNRNKRRRPVA